MFFLGFFFIFLLTKNLNLLVYPLSKVGQNLVKVKHFLSTNAVFNKFCEFILVSKGGLKGAQVKRMHRASKL